MLLFGFVREAKTYDIQREYWNRDIWKDDILKDKDGNSVVITGTTTITELHELWWEKFKIRKS